MQATAEPMRIAGLGAGLTEGQARDIYRLGEETVVFALLQLAQQLAESKGENRNNSNIISPSTPSGMRPIYAKPPGSPRHKRPGRKNGHPGACRSRPDRIDRRLDHRLTCCPHCQGKLDRCAQTRTRMTEDIPENIQPVITEHTIHRDWCPQCKQHVEPVVTEALPGATLGHRVLVLSAWLHYGLGNTLSQIVAVFGHHLQLELTPGGLVQMGQRLAQLLRGGYEQIRDEALQSAVLHADETGWRVNGKTHWLWCFSAPDVTFYMIDRCRGSPALLKFFQQEFGGALVTDFWGAYNAVACSKRQMCLVHLLRDLEHVETYRAVNQDWPAFAKKLRRLIGDAIRLWKRDAVPADEYASRRSRLEQRLTELIEAPWDHADARRLIKRLRRHADDLFTFLDEPGVPFDNNHAERAIRPAVIIRKNSQSNRSERGADTQAVLMSVYRTLKQRGHSPIQTVTDAIKSYLSTGQLPPLPPKATANG
jgi:transposase